MAGPLLVLATASACTRDEWTFRARDAAADRADARDVTDAADGPPDIAPPPDVMRLDVAPMDVSPTDGPTDVPQEPPPPDVASDRLDASDGADVGSDRVEVGVDAPPDALTCPMSTAMCSGRCTVLSADSFNCRGCGIACASGSFCVDGECRSDAILAFSRGSGAETEMRRVAFDAVGNVYVLAFIDGSITVPGMGAAVAPQGGGDWLLVSFTRQADFRWAQPIGSSTGNDRFNPTLAGLVTDASNNVYVAVPVSGAGTIRYGTATTAPAATSSLLGDAFVASFTTEGRPRWGQVIGGDEEDIVSSITLGPNENVYVTGSLRGRTIVPNTVSLPERNTGGGTDLFVLGLLRDSGAAIFARRFGAPGANMIGISVAATRSGDLVVSSVHNGGATVILAPHMVSQAPGEPGDGLLFRMRLDGTVLWTRQFAIPNVIDGVGPVLALPDDEVAYAGSYRGALTLPNSGTPGVQLQAQPTHDAFLARYSAAGAYVGHAGITTGGEDIVQALGIDRRDALYALGLAPGTGRIGNTTANPPLSPFLLRRDGMTSVATGAIVSGSVASTINVRGMAFDRLGAVAFVGSSTADSTATWAMFGRGNLAPGTGSRTWLAIFPQQ